MDRMRVVKVGDKITAKWANDLISEVRRQNIIPGNGLKKTVTSSGTILSLDTSKKSKGEVNLILPNEVYIAQVVGETNQDGSIPVDVYSTDGDLLTRATAFRPDLMHFSTMDIGTRFLVHDVSIDLTEGTENI